jgi:hypothetical protein
MSAHHRTNPRTYLDPNWLVTVGLCRPGRAIVPADLGTVDHVERSVISINVRRNVSKAVCSSRFTTASATFSSAAICPVVRPR